jgi:hypothetical protein
MLIYRNHKQVKTNTSHNDRALSVAIHTYIQYYKKMVGQTQRPWVRQNPSSCLTQCQREKKSFWQTLCRKKKVNLNLPKVTVVDCS